MDSQALPYCHDGPACEDLAAAVRAIKPSVLIGISDGSAPIAFTADVCAAMAAEHRRPVIFPLSQPGARSACGGGRWGGGSGSELV